MKALVSTTQNASDNYGAILQAYAFSEVLKELNIDCEFINIRTKSRYFAKVGSVRNVKPFLYHLKQNLKRMVHILPQYVKIRKNRAFVNAHLKLTKQFKTRAEFIRCPVKADVYITGGDQMFNTFRGVSDLGLLNFGDPTKKRISYSTNMGTGKPQEELQEKFKNLIQRYTMVSVREKENAEFIREYCGMDAKVHIDPVFLLPVQQWRNISHSDKAIHTKPYILLYLLKNHERIEELVHLINPDNQYDIVVISTLQDKPVKCTKNYNSAGISEFLNLFANASKIITTSFHGTCFSLLFQKEFYALVADESNIRISELLNCFGLSDRLVLKDINEQAKPIDFHVIEETIQRERAKSLNYLSEALLEGSL